MIAPIVGLLTGGLVILLGLVLVPNLVRSFSPLILGSDGLAATVYPFVVTLVGVVLLGAAGAVAVVSLARSRNAQGNNVLAVIAAALVLLVGAAFALPVENAADDAVESTLGQSNGASCN